MTSGTGSMPDVDGVNQASRRMLEEAFGGARRQRPGGYIDDLIGDVHDWGFAVENVGVPTKIMAARGGQSVHAPELTLTRRPHPRGGAFMACWRPHQPEGRHWGRAVRLARKRRGHPTPGLAPPTSKLRAGGWQPGIARDAGHRLAGRRKSQRLGGDAGRPDTAALYRRTRRTRQVQRRRRHRPPHSDPARASFRRPRSPSCTNNYSTRQTNATTPLSSPSERGRRRSTSAGCLLCIHFGGPDGAVWDLLRGAVRKI